MHTNLILTLARLLAVLALVLVSLAPLPADAGRAYVPHHDDVWEDLAHCESTHGEGSDNLYQFSTRTWRSMPERAGVAGTHTPAEQLASAKALLARSGPGQWPYCGRAIGLTRADAYPIPPITG